MISAADSPLVSVILPLYNGAGFIEKSAASVLGQSLADLELLIIDDGSSDNGSARIPADPRVRFFRRENSGVAATRNFGLEKARGDFIAFIDQDDWWHPDKLKQQLEVLRKQPEIGYTLTLMENRLVDEVQKPGWLRDEQLEKAQVGLLPSSLVAHRRVFDTLGGFDENLVNASDLDWFVRADKAGIRRKIINQVLLTRTIHAANASHASKLSKRETFMIIKRQIEARRRAGKSDDKN